MAFDYTKTAALATRLIAKFGRSMVAVRQSRTPADSNRPWEGPDVSSPEWTETITGVVSEPTGEEDLGAITDKTGNVPRIDSVIFVSASTTNDLRLADQIRDDGDTWRVVFVKVLQPGATKILYQIGVRQ